MVVKQAVAVTNALCSKEVVSSGHLWQQVIESERLAALMALQSCAVLGALGTRPVSRTVVFRRLYLA